MLLPVSFLALLPAILANPVPNTTTNGHENAQNKTTRPLLEHFDSLGAWFDGVDAITQPSTAHPSAKNSTIAIIGGGISGLATALMLDSVGVHNW